MKHFAGIDFFPMIGDSLEESLESNLALGEWVFEGKPRVQDEESIVPVVPVPNDEGQAIVYITRTGKKYHKEGCRYLGKSKIAITLEEAKEKGLQPCKVCKP